MVITIALFWTVVATLFAFYYITKDLREPVLPSFQVISIYKGCDVVEMTRQNQKTVFLYCHETQTYSPQ